MKWVLSHNLFNEKRYEDLIAAITRFGSEIVQVKTIPFTDKVFLASDHISGAIDADDVVDLPNPDAAAIAIGTYTLAKIASERGWKPGAFLDGLDYESWSAAWGDRILNPNAAITTMGSLEISEQMFIRPVEDSKSFAGKVFQVHEWNDFKNGVLGVTNPGSPLNELTKVMASKPREIYSESRIWVVDGRIVTHSEYKRGSTVHYSPDVDPDVLSFARDAVAQWTPNKAFVIDIAQTPDGCKVVEVNCLNSAGFYAGNMYALVDALECLCQSQGV